MAASRRVRLLIASKASSSAPTKAGDIDRSMASEKRSMMPISSGLPLKSSEKFMRPSRQT
jgi:hypothetical protein